MKVLDSRAARLCLAFAVAAGLALTGAAVAPAASAETAPAFLTSLDCRSVTQCVAVGDNNPDHPTQLEGDNWNGTAWVRVTMPSPPGSVRVRMNGVACPASHPCVAVGKAQPKSGGSYAIGALWNGKSWSVARAAAPGAGSQLTAVACPAVHSCYAAGSYLPKGSGRTVLIEHWNGTAWAQQPAAAPPGSHDGILYSISCAATSMCVAIGDDNSGPLIERWNGKAWAATRPPSSTSESIWSVSCPATTRCFAVGENNLGLGVLVDQWNGKTWTRSFPVVAADFGPMLKSVSCSSASACIVVGNDATVAFADRWDGQDWVPLKMTFTGGTPRSFGQVRCLSATSCVALAGGSGSEFWNGSTWRTVPTT